MFKSFLLTTLYTQTISEVEKNKEVELISKINYKNGNLFTHFQTKQYTKEN